MARELCANCQYPISHCLCEFLSPAVHATGVIVLQHPSEVKNAKNTVRLLNLVSSNCQTLVGETEQDFAELKQQILRSPSDYVVLFPDATALRLRLNDGSAPAFKYLIVIDGTWKKAKKILFQNTWLNDLVKVSFDQSFQSQYQIRSSKVEGGLSTIEAVAFALNQIEAVDTEPFITALEGLKHSFTKNMPEHVKARYKN